MRGGSPYVQRVQLSERPAGATLESGGGGQPMMYMSCGGGTNTAPLLARDRTTSA